MRGARFIQSLLPADFPGKAASPGKIKPAGAFLYTVLFAPEANSAGSKWAMVPVFVCGGKYGSHRNPPLIVNRDVAFQASCR